MLRLHNTLTRRKEWFRPLVEGKVGIYTCGPTLHDHAHVGLIRRLLTVDLLKRLATGDPDPDVRAAAAQLAGGAP